MMRIVAAAAAVAAALAVAAAVSGFGPDHDELRVAYFPNVGHAIPIVGLQEGIFAERLPNVTITPVVFDSGPQVIESIFAGSVDLAYVGPGPAINGFLNSGQDIRILAGAASGGASMVVWDGGFSFDNSRIGAPTMGNTQDVSLRHHIGELGLVPAERGGTVTIHNVANPDIYTLFVKGDIDGAWVPEPWATILVDEGGVRLFYEEDLWPDNRFASVLLVASMEYVDKNPDIVARWLEAHQYTADFINSDRDAAVDSINEFLKGYLGRGMDRSVLSTALSNMEITPDAMEPSVLLFAERAHELGYLGRGTYNIDNIFVGVNASGTRQNRVG